jgi:hypothetical protein
MLSGLSAKLSSVPYTSPNSDKSTSEINDLPTWWCTNGFETHKSLFHVNVAAMAELTILDAPETPAPVFAFRALKGVIFGSPNDDDERNKENAKSPKQITTLRSKISALKAPPISPSKRRKINQYASPAKSILRTPGIPTPRRQNANVTFKDVTPSLSPEMMRKETTVKERLLEIEGKGAIAVTVPEIEEAPSAAPEKIETVLPIINKPQAVKQTEAPERTHDAFNFEAYKLSTEKEMKKLVRYGQKMREYARKQDEVNTKLRIAVEQLQKENEELRKRETMRGGARQEKQDPRQVKQEKRREIGRSGSSRNTVQESEDRKLSKSVVDRTNTTSTSTARQSVPITKNEAPPGKSRQSSPLKRKASTQLRPEPSLAHISKSVTHSSLTRPENIPAEDPAPASGPGTARLPLDRVAAARERIRLKAELRRKNAAGASSPVNWNGL